MSAKKAKKKSPKDYEELGRRLENIYTAGYVDKKEMMKMSFLKGVLGGLGGVIGATIVVALLIWLLSLFDTVPLIGPLIENIQDSVKTAQ